MVYCDILRKPKLSLPCYSIMPSDDYINVEACSHNRLSPSSVNGKNHPCRSCQAFFPMLTIISWYIKVGKMLLFSK